MKKEIGLILGGIFLFSLVLTVGLIMAATTQPTTASVTVNTFLSVTIDDAALAFGTEDPLARSKPVDDPLVATIGSESNVNANIKTKANGADLCTDFPTCSGTGGQFKFPVSFLEWGSTDTFPGVNYTTTAASVCGSVAPGASCNIFHELTIPGGQAAGAYDVAITISAT